MKISSYTKLIGVAALSVALFASSATWAMTPRQHFVRGIIQNTDHDAHTFTVAPTGGGKHLVFVWKEYTRFRQRGTRICSGALAADQPVKLYYRREIGQLVPREISLRSDAHTPCATNECCIKRR